MKECLFALLFAASVLAGVSFAQPSPSTTETKSPAAIAGLEAMLVAQEKESWESVKRHDAAAFANLCRDDAWELYGDGQLLPIKDVIAQIPDTDILEYKMEDVRVFVLNDQTAIVRYRILAKISYKGNVSPPQWMLASAVWTKTGNTWKAAMYQETPAPKS
jgi:ketosteroid isomerase-like protein